MAPYKINLSVGSEHIDQFKHVNNEVYITWMMKAAIEHSTSLGYSLEKYVADGAAFVVRRHEIDYLAPAVLGDELVIETWVGEMDGVRCTRFYRITRLKDQKVVLEAKTFWVYVSLKTGRPTAIPVGLVDVFLKLKA